MPKADRTSIPPRASEEPTPLRPSRAQWNALCAELIGLARTEAAPLLRAELALIAVLRLLQGQDGLMQAGAITPLLTLGAALHDLREGRRPPLLAPRGRGGRPGTPSARATLIGTAARCLAELIDAGEPQAAAAARIAAALNTGKLAGEKPVRPETIIQWRYRCEEGPPAAGTKPAIAAGAIENYRALLRDMDARWPGTTHRQRGETLLRALAASRGRLPR